MVFVEPYAARIHKALYARVTQVTFPLVTYDETSCMQLGEGEPCAGFRTNMVASAFGTPERNRQEDRLERTSWGWLLIIKFNREVNLEAFEASLLQDPPRLPRDATHDQQATLRLEDARYTNPTQNQPATGTEAVYRFNVELTPV